MRKHSTKTLVCACAASALAAVLLALCALFFFFGGSAGTSFMLKINAVRSVIDEHYIGTANWEEIENAAAGAMVESLGDRWSYYMTAEHYEIYKNYAQNTSRGIGVTVSKDEETGGFLIEAVSEDSPAQRAGLSVGDVILSVAGAEVKELDVQGIREAIHAQPGDFEITALSGGAMKTVMISVGIVFSDPVSYEMLEDGIGYIKIKNFEAGAASGAIAAVEALMQDGAAALVIDVRGNPGGKLSELIELLDHILPQGDLFISVSEDGSERVYTSDESCVALPMAVLINADSYSAAEFFAAALSEYDWAVVVGQASTGKSRSQVTMELFDGAAVHISTRRYLTPGRFDLAERGGFAPDIEVLDAEEGDPQLAAAILQLLQ